MNYYRQMKNSLDVIHELPKKWSFIDSICWWFIPGGRTMERTLKRQELLRSKRKNNLSKMDQERVDDAFKHCKKLPLSRCTEDYWYIDVSMYNTNLLYLTDLQKHYLISKLKINKYYVFKMNKNIYFSIKHPRNDLDLQKNNSMFEML